MDTHLHQLISYDGLEDNKENLLSYANMRDVLTKVISRTGGMNKIYLENVLDILDLSAELARHSPNEKIEAEIYSILA